MGEENSKFFQAMATERYRKNSIASLQLSDGTVSSDHGEIAKEFLVAFKGRMGTVRPILLGNEILSLIPRVQGLEVLTQTFQLQEIEKVIKEMPIDKAPGPDGMPAVVFRKYCHLMGRNIIEEVRHVLEGGEMSAGWNDTHVVLIPKVKKPSRIKDLRPINLCNVLYKIISKVMSNRLNLILPKEM